MNATNQLEKCKEELAKRDQTIFHLTQEIQRLKDQNSKLAESNLTAQSQRKERNLTLQSNVKVAALK